MNYNKYIPLCLYVYSICLFWEILNIEESFLSSILKTHTKTSLFYSKFDASYWE